MPHVTCRPLTTWPVSETRGRRRDRFGTGFERTLDDLYRELVHLRCQRAVIELDITESDIRNDGWPRASARARTPRVVLSLLDSRHGPLRYPCDTYLDWRANLRAIALSLEHLRGVDRHGVTRRGEQYAGWRALSSGPSEEVTLEEAGAVLCQYAGDGAVAAIAEYTGITSEEDRALWIGRIRSLIRSALRAAHPDTGGSSEAFHRVMRAREVLSNYTGEAL